MSIACLDDRLAAILERAPVDLGNRRAREGLLLDRVEQLRHGSAKLLHDGIFYFLERRRRHRVLELGPRYGGVFLGEGKGTKIMTT